MQRPIRSPWLAVLAIAFVALVLRGVAFSGTELYSDEAYYWLWAQRPAAGYFDHPPLVAWLVAAGAALASGELGVRLLFLIAGGATVVFAALLARELADVESEQATPPDAGPQRAGRRAVSERGACGGGAVDELAPVIERGACAAQPSTSSRIDEISRRRAAVTAALLAAAAPLMNLLGAMALPDAPLAAAYTASLWLIARARGTRWLWAGVAVGLALLAKYTAALLAPALVVTLLWDRELRSQLRRPAPWFGALLAVALFAPCLGWNARHEFVSIRFQLGHGFASNATPRSFLEYLIGQLAGAGPVPLLAGTLYLARSRSAGARRVAAAVLLPLAVTTWSALRGKVEANWPAMVYPALCAAAAVTVARWRPGVSRAMVWASVALTVGALAFFAAEQRHPRLLAGTPAIERFHGWRLMADEARSLTQSACADVRCQPSRPFLVCASYQYAAELAYYGGFRRFGPAVERPSQLDVWGDRPADGEAILFVGVERPGGELRVLRAEGEGDTAQRTIAYQGEPLRQLSVTPFSRYTGEVPRG